MKVIDIARKRNKKVDAIEVMNGRNLKKSNHECDAFASKYGYSKIAGSDAHTAWEIGNAYTICDTNDIEEFRKLIKKKKTFTLGNQRGAGSIIGSMIETKSRRLFRF